MLAFAVDLLVSVFRRRPWPRLVPCSRFLTTLVRGRTLPAVVRSVGTSTADACLANRLSLALGMLGLTFSLQRICSSLAVRPKGPC
jgi:hypothetical protein